MTNLDYWIVAAYLIGLLAMGFAFRNQTSRQDYFLAGRTLAWPALALSVMATQLSAVSFISAPAFVGLREGGGLIWLSYELALPIAILILLWHLLPTLYSSGVVSIYDYLERRFNRFTRLLISGVFQLSRSFATAIMIYAISLILQSTLDLALWQSVMAIGVITLIYSAAGGMKAVVYGDALQMILIVVGALICLFTALHHLGGWSELFSNVDPQRLDTIRPENWGIEGSDFGLWPMLFGGIVLYASYYGCDQSEAQRSLSAQSLGDLRKLLLAVALCRFPITLLYCAAGLAVGTLALTVPEFGSQIPSDHPDWMMPIFITQYLPAGLVGLLIVAILAAAMSSLSSAINSLAAVSVEDFHRARGTEHDSGDGYVRQARVAGIGWGLVTVLLSMYAGDIAPTIIEAINKVGSVFYGPILGVFLLAIHSQTLTARGANIGLIAGVVVNVSLWLSGNELFWFWWNVTGLIATVTTAYASQWLLGREPYAVTKHSSSGALTRSTAITLLCWSACILVVCMALEQIF